MVRRVCSVVVLGLFAAGCSRELTLPPSLPSTGFLSGRAVEEIAGTNQAQPVQGALVSVPGTNLHSSTDQQGVFTLGPLPVGTFSVLLSDHTSTGEARERMLEGVAVPRGATASVGDVSLHRNAQVAGRALLDANARGNTGIVIFVPGTAFTTSTGDNGAYLLRDLPEGVVRVSAYRSGFLPSSTADMSVQGGVLTTAVDLVLPATSAAPSPGAISGSLAVIDGDPSQASVSIYSTLGGATPIQTVHAAADGSFALTGLNQDLYRLRANLGTYPPLDVPNLLVTSGTAIHLPDALVLSPLGSANIAFDGGLPGAPDAGPDAGSGSDAGPDAGSDAGSPQCASDADCSGGLLCQDGFCVPCARDADCQSGYLCAPSGACIRQCLQNGDCAPGQVCGGGRCGACVASSDCKDPVLVCLAGGACGHCRDGNDCPSGKACLAAGCGTCTRDGQCGAGNLCSGGVCVPGQCHDNGGCLPTETCQSSKCVACTGDGQCSAGRICISGQCQVGDCTSNASCGSADACLGNLCGACAQSTDCRPGQVCDPASHACTAGDCNVSADCTIDGQVCVGHSCSKCGTSVACPADTVCSAGLCVPGTCLLDAQCPAGEICTNHSCGPCAVDGDCHQSGLVCVGNACTPGHCTVDGECPQGQLCNASLQCVACVGNAQCNQNGNSGRVCAQGLCAAGTCATPADCTTNGVYNGKACVGLACAACTADVQCPASRLCLGGVCTLASCRSKTDCPSTQACVNNQCGACASTGDCAGLGVCDPQLQQCVPGDCSFDLPCAVAGQVCVGHTCTACGPAPLATCAAGSVCSGGVCITGDCTPSSGCANGQICSGNFCVNCAQKSDCLASNYTCVAGACTPGECADASECKTAGQLCDASHHCVACTADAQCPGGTTTPPTGVCALGLCRPGNCHGTSDCAAVNAGFCSNNNCAPCTGKLDCAASGYVCSGGQCLQGECTQESDCPTGELCGANHFCAACTSNGQCGLNRVCASGLCKAGDCATTADCSARSPAGQVCNPATLHCGNCSDDTQCPATQKCFGAGTSAYCATGVCHGPADCPNASGTATQLCNTSTHQCFACNSAQLSGGCAAGQVCDANGFCETGNCRGPLNSADCTTGGIYNGQVCSSFTCTACSAATQSSCPAGFQLCDTTQGKCVSGNCLDSSACPAVNGGHQFCDLTVHTCKSCTSSAQCGGLPTTTVCDLTNAATLGECVPGTCAADAPCAGTGQVCDLTVHACKQQGPLPVASSATTTVVTSSGGQNAMPLSGLANVYVDFGVSGQGMTAMALDPVTLSPRWSVTDGTGVAATGSPGLVISAPGLPGQTATTQGEIFVTQDGSASYSGNYVAHSSVDGKPLWIVNGGPKQLAAGLVNGVPVIASHSGYQAQSVRADGTQLTVSAAFTAGSSTETFSGPIFGTRVLYYLFYDGLYAVDPASLVTLWSLKYNTLPGQTNATVSTSMAVYRQPGDVGDVLVWGANGGTQLALYAVYIPDATATTTVPSWLFSTTNQTTPFSVTFDGASTPLIAANGDIFITGSNGFYLTRVSATGQLLGAASGVFSSNLVMLAADGSCGNAPGNTCVIGLVSGNPTVLRGVQFNSTGTVQELFREPLPGTGGFPTYAWPTAIGAPQGSASGNLLLWEQASTGSPAALVSLKGTSPTSPSFLLPPNSPRLAPAPAWPIWGGDLGAHNKAPAYQCQTNQDCAAPSSCVLNQCVGNCRASSDCSVASQGCVLGQCGTCQGDSSCGAGQRCSGGACYTSSGPGSCSVNADCAQGSVCLQAQCQAIPRVASHTQIPTATQSTYLGASVGNDGTVYVSTPSPTASGKLELHALSAAGADLWTSPAVLTGVPSAVSSAVGVARLSGAGGPDTLVSLTDGASTLATVTGANAAGGGGVTTLATLPFATSGSPALGFSTALNGTSRPTLFGGNSQFIYALDLKNAVATPSACSAAPSSCFAWRGSTNASSGVPTMIGSDGTVYNVIRNGPNASGTIEAWGPDGDPAAGAGVGKQLWFYSHKVSGVAAVFNATFNGPAIARTLLGGSTLTDAIYLCVSVGSIPQLLILPVSAAGAGTPRTVPVPACADQPILVDAQGYAIVPSNSSISVVSPLGQLVQTMTVLSSIGISAGLDEKSTSIGDDGTLYVMGGNPYHLFALQYSAQHRLTQLWEQASPGNGVFDRGFPLLVPGASGGLGTLFQDWVGTVSGQRAELQYPLTSTHGLAGVPAGFAAGTTAWSTLGGDNQRRYSLRAP